MLRLVLATHDDHKVALDGVLVAADGDTRWPAAGTPIGLQLQLPESAWMADALAQLLTEWASEDAVVGVAVVTSPSHTIARFMRGESKVSLELSSPLRR